MLKKSRKNRLRIGIVADSVAAGQIYLNQF